MLPGEPPNPGQRARLEPLFDIHPRSGATIEVFFADRTMETFGSCGAGWFWWSRRRGFSPDGPATGPFATSYAAYRDGMNSRTESIVRPTSRLRERLQKQPAEENRTLSASTLLPRPVVMEAPSETS